MLTHENAAERKSIEFTWQAPASYEGGIEFRSVWFFPVSKLAL